MRFMHLAAAIACLTSAVTPAVADEPAQPYRRWQGLYVGGHAGYGAGANDFTLIPDTFIFEPGTQFQNSQDGYLAGVHAGLGYTVGPWVLGLEFAFSKTGFSGSDDHASERVPGAILHARGELSDLSSLNARLGYAHGNLLLYAKGGVARGDFSFEGGTTVFGTFAGGGAVSDVRNGWTLGGGVEYALNRMWSLRIDYGYYDFGRDVYVVAGNTPVAFDTHYHTVNIGLSYALDFGR